MIFIPTSPQPLSGTLTFSNTRPNINHTSSLIVVAHAWTTVAPVTRPYRNCTYPYNYYCANGNCVLPEESCDGIDDCGDGSDEMYCRTYFWFSSAAFCLQKYYPMDLRFEKGHCKMLWPHHSYLTNYEILKIDLQWNWYSVIQSG